MEVDLGGLGLAEVMTGALQEGDRLQGQPLEGVFSTGVLLKIWLKQGKEKRLLARILKFLEKTRKRLSRQNSTIKVRKCEEKT